MAKHVMVLLVGGRQAPNLIGVTSYKPDVVEFVVSNDARQTYASLREAVQGIPGVALADQPWLVPAYEMQPTREACAAIVSRWSDARISFNLTCASKIMGFGAYEAARSAARQTEVHAFYLDTVGRKSVALVGDPLGRPMVPRTISEYLRAYGRTGRATFRPGAVTGGRNAAVRAARRLAYGLTAGLRAKSGVDETFLKGHWLELYVAAEAQALKLEGRRVFSDVRMSLAIPTGDGAQNEIDVAALYRGQLLICSCKTGRYAFRPEHLDQLRSVSSLVGGSYCTRLFITNRKRPGRRAKAHPSFFNLLRQAEARQIVVVAGEQLPQLGSLLQQEAQRPTYARL